MKDKHVLLAVGGGIAAYKSAALASSLVKEGAKVSVLMTRNAKRLVGPSTFEALTGRPVHSNLWKKGGGHSMSHLSLADMGDLMIVAPATGDLVGKFACGIADDLVTTTFLALDCPVLIAPAMNTRMWNHPAVQDNMATLKQRGVDVVGPGEGRLASGAVGVGRMAEPDEILQVARAILGG